VGGGQETPHQERRVNIHEAARRLIAAGATEVEIHDEPGRGDYWIVMLDPEANEFCVQ
jgi:hypothetical protein